MELPRPRKPKFIGHCSAACSILPTLNGPPQSMPTVIGPSEPPIIVVMPVAIACSHQLALNRNARARRCRPASRSCPPHRAPWSRLQTIRSGSTPSMIAGIAGLADADDPAVLDAEIALDDAEHRIDDHALHSSMSSAPMALSKPASPMPSRSVLPPPCRHSSPGRRGRVRPRPTAMCRRAGRHRRWSGRTSRRSRGGSSWPWFRPP